MLIQLVAAGAVADTHCHNGMLQVCANAGDMAAATAWFETHMQGKTVQPDRATFNILLGACAAAGDTTSCKMWFDRLQNSNLALDSSSYACYINAAVMAPARAAAGPPLAQPRPLPYALHQ